jgi:hypothetical protein
LALELTDEAATAFEAHVNECESCWQELVELRDLGLDLDDPALQRMVMAAPSPLPDDFTDQVMSRIEAERPRGVNVVWPWVRQRWSRRQVASAAYAMSATAVVISAGELLYVWNQTTDRLGVLAVQSQAYWDAAMAHASGYSSYLLAAWQWIGHLF